MNTINSLSRTGIAASTTSATVKPAAGATAGGARAADSTVVSLGAQQPAGPTFVWENRTRSTAAVMMAQNFGNEPMAGRLKGLGAELLRQVAYDGQDFSQSIQRAPDGVQADTYDMLVAPTQVSQHGMGDNRIALTITTRSGVKLELALDAGDNSVAIKAQGDGKLNDTERKALGKLADAFQQAVDGITEDPPRIDLAGLTQFDQGALASVDLKASIKLNPRETQKLDFHADGAGRSVSIDGPSGSAKIGVDLTQPAAWGSKEQQAKALDRYVQQVDQASGRGQARGAMPAMFKDAFIGMNSSYGTPAVPPAPDRMLGERDQALTTGLADFNASFSLPDVASNPARPSEKDSFSYELSQKTQISGKSAWDLSVSQQQQSRLKASYHQPVKAGATLALDLSSNSQNYKYVTIDDTASSNTSFKYDRGLLAKASHEMQAARSTRVLEVMFGKVTDDHTTPEGKSSSRDLMAELKGDVLPTGAWERAQALDAINDRIFLQANPDAIADEPA
ncbi:hypothetical protein J2X54_003219 [Duganella sp. 3397]|uniref:hypothetical protein n=1 Tax=Duganella sp. 3397 TaxID=2817732 RepID=UPI002857085B|nr:hypothetical protein [Duganella sp. 3397]MDR7050738.1 hypothetical protein [Duganella sp. 3397]